MRVSALALAAVVCWAANEAAAQTVQLPTFSFAGVGTTVIVPDRGAAFLGGITRESTGRSEYGIPGLAVPGLQNRGIGQETSASSFWVTATIHDFDAMDQALLNTPSPSDFAGTHVGGVRGIPNPPAAVVAPSLRRNPINLAGAWRPEPAVESAPVPNVAAEEASRAARRAARSAEAESYFARGQQAEAEGKAGVANIYYQMAARRANGDLREQILARLHVVSGRTTALATSTP